MAEWIRRRAAEIRKRELKARQTRQQQSAKAGLIQSHDQEFFSELATALKEAVETFNREFPEPERRIEKMEKLSARFVIRRSKGCGVEVEGRLDQAHRFLRYSIVRSPRVGTKNYRTEGSLEFDVSAKGELLFRGSSTVPMTKVETVQLLLEPFFEF